MQQQDIVISNRLGLHARAAAKLVQLLQDFRASVWLLHHGREINAKSIMGVMMLAAGQGSVLTVRAEGDDAAAALAAVIDLFDRKFDEGA